MHFGDPYTDGEITLLVVASAVTAFVHGPAQIARSAGADHRAESSVPGLATWYKKVQNRFHEVVGLDRATRDIDDWQPCHRSPVPAEVVG